MSLITGLTDLINRFGAWVKALFNNSEKIYNQLTEAEKQAANFSYGVIAVLNKYVDDVPAALDAIGIKYPQLAPSVLHGLLDTLIKDVGIIVTKTPLTLEDAATEVSNYLKTLNGQTWQQISQTLGNLLAISFSPDTPIQKFAHAAEFIYRAIVKPHVEKD